MSSEHKIVTPVTYTIIFVLLLGLTWLTLALTGVEMSPTLHVVVALSIASVKSVLVVLYFMHLLHSSKLVWLVVISAVLFAALMIVTISADYWTRPWLPHKWVPPASSGGSPPPAPALQ